MLKVVGCFIDKHDIPLVALAALICCIATSTAVQLLRLANAGAPKSRTRWVIVAALSSGSGIFATHFLGMLAFETGIPSAYEPKLTLVSLFLAMLLTGGGFWTALASVKAAPWLGGILVGTGIAAMHYTGMAAYEVEGHLTWDPRLILASLAAGTILAGASLKITLASDASLSGLLGGALLTLAICAHHFTGMAAVTIALDPAVTIPVTSISSAGLATAVAVASLAVLLPTGAVVILRLRDQRRIGQEAGRMRQLADAAVEGLIVCRDARIVTANTSFARLVQAEVGQLAGKAIEIFLPDPSLLEGRDSFDESLKETCLRNVFGSSIEVEVIVRTINYGGSAHRAIAVRDVSRRKLAEAELDRQRAEISESEQRFRLLAENVDDVIILGDRDMRRLYVSPAIRSILGYEPEDIIGSKATDYIHPNDIQIFVENTASVLDGKEDRYIFSLRYRHKAGHYVWIEAVMSPARAPLGGRPVGYIVTLRDITARRDAEEQIRHMALHDALTGLPNRTLFRERLEQAVALSDRTGNCFAVLACDLDRFKAVNDSLGHPAGDALLRIVATRMLAVLRPYDTIARLGGDEFAVVVPHLDESYSAACIAERIIVAVSAPVDLDGYQVKVGISIGLAVATNRDQDVDELFKRADIALYEAKAAGRNTYREFEPEAGARIAVRGQLGLEMQEAIRRGEFRLVYQPVIDARSGTVVSFEALMRWRHPLQGEISPGTFIPLAEESGLIVPLGIWALQEACREAMGWPEKIRVAVNVSAVQLRREGLETAVLSALAASGLPPNRLKLEVTESVLMQDADVALACLHRLRKFGVLIALDDFGTGYSSLSYLRRFPFDKIKIDRAFIRDIAHPDAAAIVRAVVGIGERLGMGIVAEGVETVEQLELVRREGCSQVQGYLFSRPLPPHEARLYITETQARAA